MFDGLCTKDSLLKCFELPNCLKGEEPDSVSNPNEPDSLFISNLITFNADGLNDSFELKGNFISLFGSIYNRWGGLVYDWKSPEKGWNPKYFVGWIYYFQLKIKTLGEKEISKIGLVQVFK